MSPWKAGTPSRTHIGRGAATTAGRCVCTGFMLAARLGAFFLTPPAPAGGLGFGAVVVVVVGGGGRGRRRRRVRAFGHNLVDALNLWVVAWEGRLRGKCLYVYRSNYVL